jgi:hypothetical protein
MPEFRVLHVLQNTLFEGTKYLMYFETVEAASVQKMRRDPPQPGHSGGFPNPRDYYCRGVDWRAQ